MPSLSKIGVFFICRLLRVQADPNTRIRTLLNMQPFQGPLIDFTPETGAFCSFRGKPTSATGSNWLQLRPASFRLSPFVSARLKRARRSSQPIDIIAIV
jgi:hypothetical protein